MCTLAKQGDRKVDGGVGGGGGLGFLGGVWGVWGVLWGGWRSGFLCVALKKGLEKTLE